LRADGEVWCFGDNFNGACGPGPDIRGVPPTRVAGVADAVEIAAGGSGTCARLRSGRVVCWGNTGVESEAGAPTPMKGVETAVGLVVGKYGTCVRLSGGEVRCVGSVGVPHLLVTTPRPVAGL
jgi:hypothetical protein